MLAVDTMCATVSLVVDAVGVVINILLGVAVYQKKTKEMESYSILLMNTVISDLITCSTSLFVGPRFSSLFQSKDHFRMILYQDSLIYIFSGACTFIGPKICYMGMGANVALFAQIAPVLLYSFGYRYFVIRCEKVPEKNTVIGLLFLSWLYPLVILCFVSQYIVEHLESDMSSELQTVHPELNISALTIAASPSINSDYRASIPTICVVVPVVPILILSLTLRHVIMKKLESLAIISEKTRQLNNNLMQTLTWQACLPLCFLFGAAIFWIDKQFQIHNTLLEYALIFMVGACPVLSPVSAFYFIMPYREWLKHQICGCFLNKGTKTVAITNGAVQSRAGRRNSISVVQHQLY